ncbi:MAG: hypothetical protein HYR83_09710 [Planctomycetes bacterium]|nr:hypothetical protein [Planctomycetota bacterium]
MAPEPAVNRVLKYPFAPRRVQFSVAGFIGVPGFLIAAAFVCHEVLVTFEQMSVEYHPLLGAWRNAGGVVQYTRQCLKMAMRGLCIGYERVSGNQVATQLTTTIRSEI